MTNDASITRPNFVTGRYLTAQALSTEQNYRQQRLRFHQRYLHGWGVKCGLGVVPAADPTRPWAVQVCPGYGLDCCGDEIFVLEPALVDIREHLWKRPLDQQSGPAYIRLRYSEEPFKLVPVDPLIGGCNDGPHYMPSRLRDSFQVDVHWMPITGPDTGGFDPCGQGTAPCLDCSDNPCLFLASVSLPANEGDPITASHIVNSGVFG